MRKNNIQVFPSILSGDFGRLADEAKRLEDSGADGIHVDIMDGHFVPNLTFGPKALGAINRATNLFLDVHLMIYNPYDYIEQFIKEGADRITFHFEATEDVSDTIDFIRKCGKKAGLAFRPETSIDMILKYLTKCDMVLLMTVNPGFGGQKFMSEMLEKIELTRKFCDDHCIRQGGVLGHQGDGLKPFDIQVDGGISDVTAKLCANAGANIMVSGSYIYQDKDLSKGINSLRNCQL